MIINYKNTPCVVLNEHIDLSYVKCYEVIYLAQKLFLINDSDGVLKPYAPLLKYTHKSGKEGCVFINYGHIICYYIGNEMDGKKIHKEDGPAQFDDNNNGGYKAYFLYGEPHRLGGPAIISKHSDDEYYIHGQKYSKEEYEHVSKLYGTPEFFLQLKQIIRHDY